jgi:hypothetical protein
MARRRPGPRISLGFRERSVYPMPRKRTRGPALSIGYKARSISGWAPPNAL